MEIGAISIIANVLVVIWSIIRDKKNDYDALATKNLETETQIVLLQEKLKSVNDRVSVLEIKYDKLDHAINQLNINVGRVLTILEQKK